MQISVDTRKKIGCVAATLFLSCALGGNAGAAEPGKDAALLLHTSDGSLSSVIAGFDFDPSVPGIELIIGNDGETTIVPGAPGPVRGEVKVKASFYSPDGTSLLGEMPTLRVWSDNYPDPGDVDNQQGGVNETWYGSNNGDFRVIQSGTPAADAREQVLDNVGFPIGFGIGATNGGTTRTLVFGLGIDLVYFTNATGDVGVSKYKFTSLDATTLTQLCVIVIPAIDQWGWDFEAGDGAALGNYLAGNRASDDEIKITKYRERALVDEQQTIYYDPRTCAEISRANLIARRP